MEVVESGSKNIEVAVMRNGAKLEVLPEEQIESICKIIEEDVNADNHFSFLLLMVQMTSQCSV